MVEYTVTLEVAVVVKAGDAKAACERAVEVLNFDGADAYVETVEVIDWT